MAQQNVEFNIGANVTGMEAIATLINRVGALEAETKRLTTANAGLASSTDAVIKNGTRYNNAIDAQSKELRNARQGTQQLGAQINDFATSVSTGTSVVQAFNQQIGQVGYAMSMMGGTAGKVGTFLAGPWGAAITMGVAVLAPFISKLFETSAAAEEAAAKLQTTAQAARNLVGTENALALNAAQMKLNKGYERRLELEAFINRQVKDRGGRPMFSYRQQKELLAVNQEIMAQESLVKTAIEQNDKLTAALEKANKPLSSGRSSTGGARRAGQSAGVEYRKAAEEEIRRLNQTTNEIFNQLKPFGERGAELFKPREKAAPLPITTDLAKDFAPTLKAMEEMRPMLKELEQSFANIGMSVSNAFKGMLTGAMSWKDGMKGIINSVIDELFRLYVVQQIVGFIGGALKGIGLPMPKIAGARANGGNVSGNRPYLVGENGPELMVPGGSGTIIPNRNLGMASSGSGMTINVDARGASDPAAVRAQVQQGILEAAPAIIAAAEARTVQGMRRPRLGGAMQ